MLYMYNITKKGEERKKAVPGKANVVKFALVESSKNIRSQTGFISENISGLC